MEGKNSAVVYIDWIHIFEKLKDDEAGRLAKHFFRYINDLNPEPPDRITDISFEPIKQRLKTDLVKWKGTIVEKSDAGRLGGVKSGESRRKQKEANEADASILKQTQANEPVLVNVLVPVPVLEGVNEKDLRNADEKSASKKNPLPTDSENPEKEKEKTLPKKEKEIPTDLYSRGIAVYSAFHQRILNLPIKMDGVQGKAMKEIISYLKTAVKEKTDDAVCDAWKMILDRYSSWDPYYQGQIKLNQINSNLPNILNSIKNGSKKPTRNGAYDLTDLKERAAAVLRGDPGAKL